MGHFSNIISSVALQLNSMYEPYKVSEYFNGSSSPGLWYRSQFLREAQVNLFADDVCRHKDYYENLITDNMFCAGRPDWSQDACEVFLHVGTRVLIC